MYKILAYDYAKSQDCTIVQYNLSNLESHTIKSVLKVGDEYPVSEYELKKIGLPEGSRLIIVAFSEVDDIPYMKCLVR